MSNASTTIPNLFYDIISRIIPGIAAVAGISVLLVLSHNVRLDTTLVDYISSINLLLLALTLAYLFGSLLETFSRTLDVILRYGYDPTMDYLKIGNAERRGKHIVYWLEIILGLPFSLFLLNEYRPIRKDSYISDLRDVIKKRFGKNVLESHMNLISCRDYIRVREKEVGATVSKMSAESAMCRHLVMVFLLLFFISIYYSLESAMLTNLFLCTLSFANFSYRRRVYVIQIYNFFFAIEKSHLQKSSLE
jgi:predicted nucleotidyltransferase